MLGSDACDGGASRSITPDRARLGRPKVAYMCLSGRLTCCRQHSKTTRPGGDQQSEGHPQRVIVPAGFGD
jgi:hypothetical protein